MNSSNLIHDYTISPESPREKNTSLNMLIAHNPEPKAEILLAGMESAYQKVKMRHMITENYKNYQQGLDLTHDDTHAFDQMTRTLRNHRMRIRINRQKMQGIDPEELTEIDIYISYQSEAKDEEHVEQKLQGGAWYTISQENRLYGVWKGFDIITCLLSSYFYAYMAAFVAPKFGEKNFTIMLIFESVFLVSMGLKFFREFTKDGQTLPTKDLKQIAERYLKTDFIYDLIPLIPFPLIMDFDGRESHLYLVKCTRMINGFRIFQTQKIMMEIRKIYQKKLDKVIKNDEMMANNKSFDQNKLFQQIMINFSVKIFKLGLIIMNICYFIGNIWYIVADITMHNEHHYWKTLTVNELAAHNTDTFIDFYELGENTATRNTIIGLYYGFTTLSTVGFGDYAPRSNNERAIGAFILISGVAMFSFLMGNFIEILSTYKDLNSNFSDDDNLTAFFMTMRHFNKENDFNIELKKKIEEHFQYFWDNDKNLAFLEEKDKMLLDKLPHSIQDKLYQEFLFTDFIDNFQKNNFQIPRATINPEKIYYDWEDQVYREFMIEVLTKLEPRSEHPGTILYRTIEEVQEIFFIVAGSVEIGFEINREPKYVLRLSQGQVIGMYHATFDKKTMFNYRIKQCFRGFTIRKENWRQIIQNPDYKDITGHVTRKCKTHFKQNVKRKVLQVYRKYIGRLKQRKDKTEILTVLNLQTDQHLLMIQQDSEEEPQNSTSEDENQNEEIEKLEQYMDQVAKIIKVYEGLNKRNVLLKRKIEIARAAKELIFSLQEQSQTFI